MKELNDVNANSQKIPTKNINKKIIGSATGHNFASDSGSSYSVLEEKIAELSLQANQVIVRPYLQQALDYLKSSKFDAINAYNQLSDEVANEVRIISNNSREIANRLSESQSVIQRTQDIIRNKYNNATEDEISNGLLDLDYEYNIVADHHELSIKLTQEISRYKTRIDSLLASQSLLDDSIVPSISRVQLEIDNLELLLHNFDSTNYSDILAKKQGRNAGVKMRTSPVLDARGDLLNQYAQDLNISPTPNFSNLQPNNNLNLQNMNRFEDPNNQYVNQNAYPHQNVSQRPNNNFQQQPQYQAQPVTPLVSWRELIQQRRQAKRQMLGYAPQQPQQVVNQQVNTNQAQNAFYEGTMNLQNVDDYVKNSTNDKLFVVRKGKDISASSLNNMQTTANKNDPKAKLRSIKVVK